MLAEAEDLYHTPGIPWVIKRDLLKMIGQQKHGVFKDHKENKFDVKELIRRLTLKDIRDALEE